MRKCLIDRCELFNKLATVTASDANEMKAKIYTVIQSMEAESGTVYCRDCKWSRKAKSRNSELNCTWHHRNMLYDDYCSYWEEKADE